MQFILYCFCGGLGVLTDYGVYYAAVKSDLWYQAANVLGYASGTVVSFLLNRIITFGARDRAVQRFALFAAVAATGFSFSAAMLWVLVAQFGVAETIAKLLTLPIVVAIQFLLNRAITFRDAPRPG